MLARINRSYVPAYWDDFFNDKFFNQLKSTGSGESRPAVNISEDEKGYTIELAVPGVAKDKFSLEIENDVLILSSEQEKNKDEQKPNYLRREFSYQSFKRSFELPETIDQEQINATIDAGILTLSLPKKEEEVQKAPRQIEVK